MPFNMQIPATRDKLHSQISSLNLYQSSVFSLLFSGPRALSGGNLRNLLDDIICAPGGVTGKSDDPISYHG
jgi:hypothetical protein